MYSEIYISFIFLANCKIDRGALKVSTVNTFTIPKRINIVSYFFLSSEKGIIPNRYLEIQEQKFSKKKTIIINVDT